MKIELLKKKSINSNDINAFVKEIGYPITKELHSFLINYNGSTPEPNFFRVNKDTECSINKFIPLGEMIKEKNSYLNDLGSNYYPIADAEGGNYLVIDFSDRCSVYFWDHEQFDKLFFIAKDIDSFLKKLDRLEEINVEPEDVISVWVDPKFLKDNS